MTKENHLGKWAKRYVRTYRGMYVRSEKSKIKNGRTTKGEGLWSKRKKNRISWSVSS